MEHVKKRLRHELKYYINYFQYRLIGDRIRWALKKDRFSDDRNEYSIRSLYFDDIYNSSLFEKVSGVECRKKFRIRIYNVDDRVIKLEKKMKFGQLTAKESALLTRKEAERIIGGDVDFMLDSDSRVMREFYFDYRNMLLKPAVIVDYVREAYIHPLGNVRITFDKYLSTGLCATDIFNKSMPKIASLDEPFMIMEVKYDEFLPEYIRGLLQVSALQRMSISKYTICRKFIKTNNWEDN